jgi:HlyD family secretion protein
VKAVGWRRVLGLGALGLLTVGGLLLGLWPPPRPVDVAAATRGPMQVTVEEEGRTRVVDRFVVSAPVAGYARRVELDVGDAVEKGAVLAEIEPLPSSVLDPRRRAEAEARVAAAGAALRMADKQAEAARAEAELAESERRRVDELCAVHCVSEEAREQARARARSALARQRSAEFAVEVARYDLAAARTALAHSAAEATGVPAESVVLRSPVAGQVLRVYRKSEGVVEAGQALVEVGDPRALEVEVDVLSEDAVRIGPGTRILLERWGGDQALEGRVRAVEPVGFTKVSALGVEEQRVLVISDFVSEPERWQRLGDGYRVEARFVLWEATEVLQVPASAVFQFEGARAVFVVKEGRARRRAVSVGQRNGLSAEVLEGLDAGDEVVVHPERTLEDGERVAPRRR